MKLLSIQVSHLDVPRPQKPLKTYILHMFLQCPHLRLQVLFWSPCASTWRPFGSNLHNTCETSAQIEVILDSFLARKTILGPHRGHFGLLRAPKVPTGTPKTSKVIPKFTKKRQICSKMHVQCSLCIVRL